MIQTPSNIKSPSPFSQIRVVLKFFMILFLLDAYTESSVHFHQRLSIERVLKALARGSRIDRHRHAEYRKKLIQFNSDHGSCLDEAWLRPTVPVPLNLREETFVAC